MTATPEEATELLTALKSASLNKKGLLDLDEIRVLAESIVRAPAVASV